MQNPITARRATLKDRSYVRSLAKRFSDAVGFLPDEAISRRIANGHVLIALENSEPAGYLLGADRLSTARHVRPIFQAAVQMDAQRRHHGLQLLQQLEREAHASRQTIVQCFCREDLEANAFWRAAGFIPVALRTTNATRGHPCVLWRKPIAIVSAETLLEIPPNSRNHAAAGRTVPRFAWEKQPTLTLFSRNDVHRELERLGRCA